MDNKNSQPEKEPFALTIVMPVYDEEAVIGKVVEDYVQILECFARPEFIIVDDHCTDSTPKILESLKSRFPFVHVLRHEKNQGHGRTLLDAYQAATGDYVFYTDSDNQAVAEDFWRLWEVAKRGGVDVVMGHRTKRTDGTMRIVITSLARMFLAIVCRHWFPDSNVPFRLYTRSALDRILPHIPPTARFPSVLMTVAAAMLDCKVVWVGIRNLPRKTGVSFMGGFKIIKASFEAGKSAMRFRADVARELARQPRP